MEPYYSVVLLAAAFGLVFLNAFFVLSEFAIVKVRRSRLEEIIKSESARRDARDIRETRETREAREIKESARESAHETKEFTRETKESTRESQFMRDATRDSARESTHNAPKTPTKSVPLTSTASKAQLALKITQKLDSYLSATQLGITFASLALGWVSEFAIARLVRAPFASVFGADSIAVHVVATALSFILVTLFHVVLGELVPKSIAIARTERAVLAIARPLHAFWILFYPFIRTFDLLAGFFLKLLGISMAHANEAAHSDEELKIIAAESLKSGHIDSIESEIIKNAVDFGEIQAREIMTPRKDIVVLSEGKSYEQNMEIVLSTHHTRYPYVRDNKDSVLGMIHIRDLLSNAASEHKKSMDKLTREMILVPESAHIADILKDMNRRQIHTALVLDEYGGTAGLLTMEDIIEEIMGDISDEHDKKSVEMRELADGRLVVDGMTDIESVEERLGVRFEGDGDQVTIAGFVFGELGRLPAVGDKIELSGFEFEVKKMDATRIKTLVIRPVRS